MQSIIRGRAYLLSIVFLSSVSIGGTYKENIIINNFKTGGVDYVITGEKAIINGNHVHLNGVQARLKQSNGEIYLFTSECDFDQANKLGYSDHPVHIRNETMTIDGKGFQLDVSNSHVIVRKDVRVKIYNYRDDLLGQ